MVEHCRRENLTYIPACVDMPGAWGTNMRNLLNRLGGYAQASLGIPVHIYTLAWTRRISIGLARLQGTAAVQRLAQFTRDNVSDSSVLGRSLEAQGIYPIR